MTTPDPAPAGPVTRLDEPQPAEILVGGRWLPATLEAWMHDDRTRGWLGLVTYKLDRGRHYQWVWVDLLRAPRVTASNG